jgi:hypothetical protein
LSILPVYPLASPQTSHYYGNTPYNQPAIHQYQTAQPAISHNEAPEVAEHSVLPGMPSAITDYKTILKELKTVCRKNDICHQAEPPVHEVIPDIPTDELRGKLLVSLKVNQ